MSTVLVSAAEYLSTSYRPDCDFVDGQLVERNVGEYDHANLQTAVALWLRARGREWNIRVVVEQRIRVSASRYRVPDVCVISREQTVEPIFTAPPLICIEVLSKDDTLRGMQERVDDYLAFGVPNIWILDRPGSRRSYVCTRSGFHEPESGVLETTDGRIRISLADLFLDLD